MLSPTALLRSNGIVRVTLSLSPSAALDLYEYLIRGHQIYHLPAPKPFLNRPLQTRTALQIPQALRAGSPAPSRIPQRATRPRSRPLRQTRPKAETRRRRSLARRDPGAKKQRLATESRARREEEEDRKERARRKRLGLPELPPKGTAPGHEEAELTAKLRGLNEPAVLFAETHPQRLARYRALTTPSSTPQLSKGPIPTTLSLLPEASIRVPKTVPSDAEGRAYLFRQLASYFSLLLSEWARALSARSVAVKESTQGRAAESAMLQSRDNMRPLFRKFETGELPDSILAPIVEIVNAAQERRYVDANDGYLRLSIGKAAWPIGVTMVGIHERSAREKLHEGEGGKAHIMSDEVTRKFLQSIKRSLTFAQTRWPPEDQGQLMG
ncbi:hypothetical protein G7Y79_00020g048380 [Physcia stellaris]|nr:hypothetical protein G7Y79_00020g048380 [Physcia stellaris]